MCSNAACCGAKGEPCCQNASCGIGLVCGRAGNLCDVDTTPTQTTGVKTAGLFGQPAPAPAVKSPVGQRAKPVQPVLAPPPPAPAPQPYIVQAIRGAKRTEEIVR